MSVFLLTWHGTLVCLRAEGGGLWHAPVEAAVPLDLALPAAIPDGPERVRTALGPLHVQPAHGRRGVWVSRFGQFLWAQGETAEVAFDRPTPSLWETFLPLRAEDVAGLRALLAGRWIVAASRRVLPRRAVRLAPGFRLMVDEADVDLLASLPFGAPAAPGAQAFRLDGLDLVAAGPRGSVLAGAEAWPTRPRQNAQAMVLAAHRELRGSEPERAELDRDVAFLLERGGAEGLGDLLDRLRHDPAGLPPAPAAAPGAAPAAPAAPACPVVSLGIACTTARVLQRMGVHVQPMPFDWINCTPAMVRHCLETDFAVLLDRSHYRSLAGQGRPGEPFHACEHVHYAAEYGLRRVFNHNDPTEDAAYRYVQASVDRFRDLLAAASPKLFVQIRQAGRQAEEDFTATAALLGNLTQDAMLLQVAVLPPNRRLAVPLLALAASQGPHCLYTLQPVGHMDGDGFQLPVDQDFLAWVVGTHASRPALAQEVRRADRARVSEAMAAFAARRPDGEDDGLADGETIADAGNRALLAACRVAGLPNIYRFGLWDSRSAGAGADTLEVELRQEQVTLRLDAGALDPWRLMYRALPIVFVIDAARAGGWQAQGRFLAEPGDEAGRGDAASFCSRDAGALLLPDPDFFATGGYEDQRRLVAQAPAWADRRAVVFWRGSSTGKLRRPPPAPGEADDFTWLPRLEMVRRARQSPHAALYDVGVSEIVQIGGGEEMQARLADADLLRPRAPRAAFLACRAVLVIDGNSNPWSALFCGLLSGSCVLRVESGHGFRQWYYGRLKPWLHYVPVSADLSDLDDVVAWVMAHDDDARAIGAAGRALAEAMTFEAEVDAAAGRLEDRKEGLLF